MSLYLMYIYLMKASKKKPIQIYIEHGQDDALEVLAKKKGVSKASIIRESLAKYLKELPVQEDPAMGLIGLGSSDKSDVSQRHDHYLVKHTRKK